MSESRFSTYYVCLASFCELCFLVSKAKIAIAFSIIIK